MKCRQSIFWNYLFEQNKYMDSVLQTMKLKFSLKGNNIEIPKSNYNLLKLAKIKKEQKYQQHPPLIYITPNSLSKIARRVVSISRHSCGSRQQLITESQRQKQKEKQKHKCKQIDRQKSAVQEYAISKIQLKNKQQQKAYKTSKLKSRVSTYIESDFQTRKQSISKLKKCTCGDCQQCFKDFQYFLNLLPHDKSLPEISAKSWCIWKRGKGDKFTYYYGKQVHKVREIASLTKMITAMTAVDFLTNYNYDPSRIKFKIRKTFLYIGGTSASLQVDQIYSITQLLFGMMLPSGNDAAIAISQAVGLIFSIKLRNRSINPYKENWYEDYYDHDKRFYSQHFLILVSQKCQKMGLLNTKIYNSHGNDAFDQFRNVSTSNQIAKVSVQYIQKYENLKNVSIKKTYEVQRYKKVWENTNKLLDDGFEGIKTGINESSGPCLAACYKDYIVVVLNSKSMNERWIQVKKLIRWMLRKGF